jgi:hypothetical protein
MNNNRALKAMVTCALLQAQLTQSKRTIMKDPELQETLEQILVKLKASAHENNLSSEAVSSMSSVFINFFNQENIDIKMAQRVGQFFYYYAQIDEILSEIVKSLLPELDISIMGLESSIDGNSYLKKIKLIKSLTPNSENLKIFPLLEKINKHRNELAHTSPIKLNFEKINLELVSVLQEAFSMDHDFCKAIIKEARADKLLEVPIKVILVTKLYLEVFLNIERSGKKIDKQLYFFEALRGFSSLFVRRRFSILAYQIQTGSKSEDAPSHFKQEESFKASLHDLEEAVKQWLT